MAAYGPWCNAWNSNRTSADLKIRIARGRRLSDWARVLDLVRANRPMKRLKNASLSSDRPRR